MGLSPTPFLVIYPCSIRWSKRLEKANFLVEGIDELVEVLGLCVDGVPRALGVVPLGVEVFNIHALLLNPGVVLEVVDSLGLQ